MLDAIAVAVAEKGYAATTVGDVVSGAGVSRKTFYEHFADKEECFLAAWDTGVQVVFDAIRTSNEQAADPIGRMRSGLRAYLETLAAEPAFARSFFIEVVAAGPHAEARRAEVHARFADLFATMHDQARREMPQFPDVRRTSRARRSARSTSSSPTTCAPAAPSSCPSWRRRSSTWSSCCSPATTSPRRRPASERAGVLLLWDIDGTLIRASLKAHQRAMLTAVQQVYGVSFTPDEDPIRQVVPNGKTDRQIVRRCSSRAGSPRRLSTPASRVRAHRLRAPLRLALRGAGRR